jgi:hypothetical protein
MCREKDEPKRSMKLDPLPTSAHLDVGADGLTRVFGSKLYPAGVIGEAEMLVTQKEGLAED